MDIESSSVQRVSRTIRKLFNSEFNFTKFGFANFAAVSALVVLYAAINAYAYESSYLEVFGSGLSYYVFYIDITTLSFKVFFILVGFLPILMFTLMSLLVYIADRSKYNINKYMKETELFYPFVITGFFILMLIMFASISEVFKSRSLTSIFYSCMMFSPIIFYIALSELYVLICRVTNLELGLNRYIAGYILICIPFMSYIMGKSDAYSLLKIGADRHYTIFMKKTGQNYRIFAGAYMLMMSPHHTLIFLNRHTLVINSDDIEEIRSDP